MSNVSIDVRLDQGQLAYLLHSPQGDVGRYMHRVGTEVAIEAKRRAPVKSGRLRDSIHMTQGALGSIEISANVEYALAIHEGAKPHDIVGKPLLKFPSRRKGGQFIEVPKVHHPGNAPNPFLTEALEMVVRSGI